MLRHSSWNLCSPGRASLKAASLLEVMIASGLMMLVMGGLAQLMVVGASYLSMQEAKAELQKDMTTAFLWLSREMRESDADSVKSVADGIVFASPRDNAGKVVFDSAGRLLWHKFICYYVGTAQGQTSLLRKVRSQATPATSPPPAPSVDSLRLDAALPITVKARHVQKLTFDTTVSPAEVKVFAELTSSRGRTYGMEIKSNVYFRN